MQYAMQREILNQNKQQTPALASSNSIHNESHLLAHTRDHALCGDTV